MSSASPQTHTVLEQQMAMKKTLFFKNVEEVQITFQSLGSYLWSWSGTPLAQQTHRWPTEETLQLQAQSEPRWAPSSSGLLGLWSPFSLCSLIYTSWGFFLRPRRGGGVSTVMWTTGLAVDGVSDAIHWGMREGVICVRRESCILAPFWALWRSPRCASAGMNLSW